MMGGVFDIFKSESAKQHDAEEEREVSAIKEKKQVERSVYEALTTEFRVDESHGLRQAISPEESPTAILRNENQAFSMWYRLPVRGDSRATHVIDYAIFRGTHRYAQKSNPDIIIECRQLEPGKSNRTDTRTVRDTIGLSLDTLPGMLILATNRELSDIANELANSYGIKVVNMNEESAGRELLELIASDKQITREHLMKNLEISVGKVDTLITKRVATPWSKKIIEEKKERLKERVYKELEKTNLTTKQLARKMYVNEDFILNELYTLERDGKARIIERSMSSEYENLWGLLPQPKSSR